MPRIFSFLMLVTLCATTACGRSESTITKITPTSYNYASIKWDETLAASTNVKVDNASLVSMR